MKSAMVSEFLTTFDAPRDLERNIRGLNEELLEFEQALENVLKEACDVLYCSYCVDLCTDVPRGQPKVDKETIERISRVLELTKRVFGQARFDEAFARVHASNMSKRGPNGEIERHPWGKVAKGPFYQPAVLHDLVT
jgi:hypothetical protein